jgi:hypothetical protein
MEYKIDYYDKQNNFCSDSCWQQNKNIGNQKISDYQTYSTQYIPCEEPKVRLPEYIYDHVNLRGRPGYGLVEPCLVDEYNNLIGNKELLTRDKCKIQLFTRLFKDCPMLRGQNGDIDSELDIMTGANTSLFDNNSFNCKKTIMEQQINQPIPLIDCMKDIQNPNHIVPIWTNGGENSRNYITCRNSRK